MLCALSQSTKSILEVDDRELFLRFVLDTEAWAPVRTKIDESIGNFRSSSTKDRRKGSEAVGVVNGRGLLLIELLSWYISILKQKRWKSWPSKPKTKAEIPLAEPNTEKDSMAKEIPT